MSLAGTWREASQVVSPETHSPVTTLVDLRMDMSVESTLWVLPVFYLVYIIGVYGTDQIIVQRYFTMKSVREISRSILGAGVLLMLMVFALSYLGVLLVVYYRHHPELAATLEKADNVMPHYIMHALPAGARGLIFAAILAATMSTVSGGLNSLATVGMMDLYRRHMPASSLGEAHCLRVAKGFTLLAGLLLTLTALWIATYQTTILQTVNFLASIFLGPMSAVFLLGVLTRRANVAGVVVGAAAGLTASGVLSLERLQQSINWMWMAPLSCLTTLVVGYLVSLLLPGGRPAEKSLPAP